MLDTDALTTLDYLALRQSPEDLARALYGPTWREAVRDSDYGGWRTRRDPLPTHVATFLTALLRGAIAHDGRSTRDSHTAGWWGRDESGRWHPTAPDLIASDLYPELLALLDRAMDQQRYAPSAERRKSESLRVAVLSGLAHTVGAVGRNIATALGLLRERLPQLPESARIEIVREWLAAAIDLGDLEPAAGRLLVADVREAHDAQSRAGADLLPLQATYAALDAMLGPRVRRVHWRLPADDALGADGPATVAA